MGPSRTLPLLNNGIKEWGRPKQNFISLRAVQIRGQLFVSCSDALSTADRPCYYHRQNKLEFSSGLVGGPKARDLSLSRTQFLPLSNGTNDPRCCSLEVGVSWDEA